jgi:hypothetical protein
MPEDSGKAASSALGVIPNAYFDLIARVMPGCLFLFAINQVSSKNIVALIIDAFVPYGELRGSTTAWLLVTASASYILGHAFSPLVRFLEEGPQWTETVREKFPQKNKNKDNKQQNENNENKQQPVKLRERIVYCCLPPFWRSPEATEANRKQLHEDYNKLRIQSPAVAAMAIRIRAEYTMYGGFAVAIAITLVVALIHVLKSLGQRKLGLYLQGVTLDQWLLLGAGILAVPTMLYRHLHTWNRFRKTVGHFLNIGQPSTPQSQAAAAAK